MSGLQFIVENGWVLTDGLTSIDRCELAMDARTPEEIEEAKRMLTRLAGYIVSAKYRPEPGDAWNIDGHNIELSAICPGLLRVLRAYPYEAEMQDRAAGIRPMKRSEKKRAGRSGA